MDTRCTYLGLELPHPFMVGASPMVNNLDTVKRLEDAGAAAFTMPSLFEEQIAHHEAGIDEHILRHMDATSEAASYFPRSLEFSFGPERYLDHLEKLKRTVSAPVIASLNGVNLGSWIEYAILVEEAGADALELNLYFLPTDPALASPEMERRCVEVVAAVRQSTTLPLAVKLSRFFTALPHFAVRLADAGADGLVLFNRYYQPDIDIEELEMIPALQLSDSSEVLKRLRWLGILHGRVSADLAVTGGVHTVEDAIKSIMAGAVGVQMVSALLKHGPAHLTTIRDGVSAWLEGHDYDSLRQMVGSMSFQHSPDPEAIERANYMKILQSWSA